jgi:endonuclease-8
MNGSWLFYPPGEAWQRPARDMRIVLGTERFVAVGFSIPVAEFIPSRHLARHEELRRLGPDLLSDDFDEAVALTRLRARADEPIADVLLNQRVMAGIGNVYKSEVLFTCRVNPFTPVSGVSDDDLRCLIGTARKFLLANVHSGLAPMTTYTGFRRTTGRDNPRERLWVYGRAGLPCRRCGAPIRIDKRSRDARLTYWCEECQK